MEQGDIILTRFPFANMIDYKIRPSIVVSNDKFNKKFDSWICPVTSKETEHCIPLEDSLVEGKLKMESFAKTSAITSANPNLILKKIGRLSKEKTKEIIENLIQNMR